MINSIGIQLVVALYLRVWWCIKV